LKGFTLFELNATVAKFAQPQKAFALFPIAVPADEHPMKFVCKISRQGFRIGVEHALIALLLLCLLLAAASVVKSGLLITD
jgi:hypothetical protein